jgi:hypothetical protein
MTAILAILSFLGAFFHRRGHDILLESKVARRSLFRDHSHRNNETPCWNDQDCNDESFWLVPRIEIAHDDDKADPAGESEMASGHLRGTAPTAIDVSTGTDGSKDLSTR